jgi:hypothetical protein
MRVHLSLLKNCLAPRVIKNVRGNDLTPERGSYKQLARHARTSSCIRARRLKKQAEDIKIACSSIAYSNDHCKFSLREDKHFQSILFSAEKSHLFRFLMYK